MAINDKYAKAMIPLLRKLVPTVVAQDIVGVQPMGGNTSLEVCETPVHGVRYYCVEIKGWGFEWQSMEGWCRSTFGEPGEIWPQDNFVWPEAARWLMNNRKFWFHNEADRTLFLLKWSK